MSDFRTQCQIVHKFYLFIYFKEFSYLKFFMPQTFIWSLML